MRAEGGKKYYKGFGIFSEAFIIYNMQLKYCTKYDIIIFAKATTDITVENIKQNNNCILFQESDMVIYFTGTGNSEYIAKLIAERLNDSITDATNCIKSGKYLDFHSEKPFVFVAPTYAWRLPRIFEKWIASCHCFGNKKSYFVLTCGSEIGAAGKYNEKFARKNGFDYMGTAEVVMPENYLIMFEPTAKEDDLGIIEAATKHTEMLCRQISDGKAFDKLNISFIGHLQSGIVNSSFYTFYISAKKFYASDTCISCGKCVENCMTNNIILKEGKPVWGKNCTHCMSCICKCPAEAIEYGKNTKGRRRYMFDSKN